MELLSITISTRTTVPKKRLTLVASAYSASANVIRPTDPIRTPR